MNKKRKTPWGVILWTMSRLFTTKQHLPLIRCWNIKMQHNNTKLSIVANLATNLPLERGDSTCITFVYVVSKMKINFDVIHVCHVPQLCVGRNAVPVLNVPEVCLLLVSGFSTTTFWGRKRRAALKAATLPHSSWESLSRKYWRPGPMHDLA